MGRITAHTFATLDGVIDAPPDVAYEPYIDEETLEETLRLATAADALLLGRDTYQHLARAWRGMSGPIADRVNAMPKHVLSRTLTAADDWPATSVVRYEAVAGLRDHHDLLSYGCGPLARDLLRDGLLDELQVWVAPVVAGAGRRLFGEPDGLVQLALTGVRSFATGVTRLSYGPTGV